MRSRRDFLQSSPLVALSPTVPALLANSATAYAPPQRDGRVLVVLHLAGGNDGLNTVVPFRDENYRKHRRELALSERDNIKVTDDLLLHRSLRGAADLLESGRLAIVQAVGYPNPNRSHFRSSAIWNSAYAAEQEGQSHGWLGRALDPRPRRGSADAIFVGSQVLPLALRGRRSVATTMDEREALQLATPVSASGLAKAVDDSGASPFVKRSVLNAYTTVDELTKATQRTSEAPQYPATPLARRLSLIAQLVKAGLPTPVYYTLQPGYDTHAVQAPQHTRLLGELGSGLKAFFDDLEQSQLADRVLLMAFSEFGRRVQENGSLGTDHGTAGPVLIAGGGVKAGVLGQAPDLGDLVAGDIKQQFDFRQVYATVLDKWLGVDSEQALGGRFQHVPLL